MRTILVLAALTSACGGPTHEISARGFSTAIQNHALSRTTAENRAIAALQELLEPDAVSFTLKRVGEESLLEVSVAKTEAFYERVELQPLASGWMAIVPASPQTTNWRRRVPSTSTSALRIVAVASAYSKTASMLSASSSSSGRVRRT